MKICLIGSTRFMDEYRRVNRELTLAGHIVYTVATISSGATDEQTRYEAQGVTEDEKETLDLVHLRKIAESDAVYLVSDSSGYYGDSTRRELKWTKIIQKRMYQGDQSLVDLCIADWPPRWKAARPSESRSISNNLSDDEIPF